MSAHSAVDDVLRRLLEGFGPGARVDLNDVDDAIGTEAVSYEDIEFIIDALETAGRRVADPFESDDIELLKLVLDTARALRTQFGRPPSALEIARSCGKSRVAVFRTLEYVKRSSVSAGGHEPPRSEPEHS